jgi:hypothetical protein
MNKLNLNCKLINSVFRRIYNSKFWFYFTNVYTGSENYRYDSNSGACNLINQNKKYIS